MDKEKLEEYLNQQIRKRDNGCWEWWGTWGKNDLPVIFMDKKLHSARRIVWEFYTGKTLGKLRLYMTCENKICVNPDHTKHTDYNTVEEAGVKKCLEGHIKTQDKNGHWKCKECKKRWRQGYEKKNREKINRDRRNYYLHVEKPKKEAAKNA